MRANQINPAAFKGIVHYVFEEKVPGRGAVCQYKDDKAKEAIAEHIISLPPFVQEKLSGTLGTIKHVLETQTPESDSIDLCYTIDNNELYIGAVDHIFHSPEFFTLKGKDLNELRYCHSEKIPVCGVDWTNHLSSDEEKGTTLKHRKKIFEEALRNCKDKIYDTYIPNCRCKKPEKPFTVGDRESVLNLLG